MRWPIVPLLLMLANPVSAEPTLGGAVPILIAHRGASGELPEHTLAAYERAIDQGADFIEPDLVLTSDGELVARHENEISGTTDVADHPEFADRRAAKTIDGAVVSGWFTEDFTLAELRTLRAKERLPLLRKANTAFDGQFAIPTFDEILDLVKRKEAETGRRIGVYPETKHPSYFASIGLPHETPMLAALTAHGLTGKADPVFIQSFEVRNLQELRAATTIRLVQLIDSSGGPADLPGHSYAEMLTPAGLAAIARYADAIGPAKALVVPTDGAGRLAGPGPLVADAHRAGLAVHPWTFRRENAFLPGALQTGTDPAATGQLASEIAVFLSAGIDGLFSDNPAEARAAIDAARK